MASFSTVLKQLRERENLTQEELAKRLNISRSRLASYEQGQREPALELLETIADYFNVDLDYLLGRSTTTTQINEVTTIAAHKNNPEENWTAEELKEIEEFKAFVKMKRKSMK
jgi:transcriptional regulator with XRE-family HTH domain